MSDTDICIKCEDVVLTMTTSIAMRPMWWQHCICDTSISQAQYRKLVTGIEQHDDFQWKCFDSDYNDAYTTLKVKREAELHNMVSDKVSHFTC